MSDGTQPAGAPSGTGAAPVEDVWEQLGRELRELGSAIAEAMRSAADDPDNQRRARELKEGFDTVTREVGDAFSEAFSGESGERVKEAAGAVAAAGRAVTEDVKPRIASFTRKAGEVLRDAASRMDAGRGEDASSTPGVGDEGRD